MNRGRSFAEGLHLAFLGVWLGALVMIAAGAPLVFRTLEPMDPLLPEFAGYRAPHYRIAGGHIVQRLFMVCDMLQSLSAIVAGLSLAWLGWSRRRLDPLLALRLVSLVGVIGILAYRHYLLDPKLGEHLAAYWQMAREGNEPLAEDFRSLYERGHALETKLFGATAALVLTLLVLGLASIARGERPGAERQAP